jgi:hypothetical protein
VVVSVSVLLLLFVCVDESGLLLATVLPLSLVVVDELVSVSVEVELEVELEEEVEVSVVVAVVLAVLPLPEAVPPVTVLSA